MVGAIVVYRPPGRASYAEQGVITSVNERYVFVRFGADYGSKATLAGDLEPLGVDAP